MQPYFCRLGQFPDSLLGRLHAPPCRQRFAAPLPDARRNRICRGTCGALAGISRPSPHGPVRNFAICRLRLRLTKYVIAYIVTTRGRVLRPRMRRGSNKGPDDEQQRFTKAAGTGARAALREGPFGQPCRPATGFPQQGDARRRGTARGRIRSPDAEGRRTGPCRRPDRPAAMPGSPAAAVPRASRHVPPAAAGGRARRRGPRAVAARASLWP
jgi:hypothetical protein